MVVVEEEVDIVDVVVLDVVDGVVLEVEDKVVVVVGVVDVAQNLSLLLGPFLLFSLLLGGLHLFSLLRFPPPVSLSLVRGPGGFVPESLSRVFGPGGLVAACLSKVFLPGRLRRRFWTNKTAN